MRRTGPMIGMLLLLAVCLFMAGCGRGNGLPNETAASSEVTEGTGSETAAGTEAAAPAPPVKRPGVDNNPVDPPKTPDSEPGTPTTPPPAAPETPERGSREGNELPPLWIPTEEA